MLLLLSLGEDRTAELPLLLQDDLQQGNVGFQILTLSLFECISQTLTVENQ